MTENNDQEINSRIGDNEESQVDIQQVNQRQIHIELDYQQFDNNQNQLSTNQKNEEFVDISLSHRYDKKPRNIERNSIIEQSFDLNQLGLQKKIAGLDDDFPSQNRFAVQKQIDEKLEGLENEKIQEFGRGNVGQFKTYLNLFKAFIGIGILASPESFSQVGIVGGIIGVLLMGLLNYYTMQIQIECKSKKHPNVKNYSELGLAIFGHLGKYIVDLCLILNQIGISIAYLLFVASQVDQVMCYETQFAHCKLKKLYACLFGLILIPICWLKSFKYLSYVSLIGNIAIVIALTVIFVYAGQEIQNTPENHEEDFNYLRLQNLPLFFGIVIVNFEGNPVLINIHSSMKHPEKFHSIFIKCFLFVVILVTIFAAVCYYGYGSTTEDIITMNLPFNNLSASIQLFYCVGLLGSYPIQLMPAIELIEDMICFQKIPIYNTRPRIKNILFRTLIVIITVIIAINIPKFSLFINLTGSISGTLLAFIIPAFMYNKAFQYEISRCRKNFNRFIIIFGSFCGGISFIISCIEIFKLFNVKVDSK